jgi:hypothetical protein
VFFISGPNSETSTDKYTGFVLEILNETLFTSTNNVELKIKSKISHQEVDCQSQHVYVDLTCTSPGLIEYAPGGTCLALK